MSTGIDPASADEVDGDFTSKPHNSFVIQDEPKKRGRPSAVAASLQMDDMGKKKRGRKPSGKIIDLNKINLTNEYNECIIAHLPLSQKDIVRISLRDTENARNETEPNEKPGAVMISLNINDDAPSSNDCAKCADLERQVHALQDKLNKSKETHTYVHCMSGKSVYKCEPKEDESVCWWCCHKFDTLPIGLPEKYEHAVADKSGAPGKFHLHGHFCSFNCAHAYNIHMNDFKVWERYSLLNLYKKKSCPPNDDNTYSKIMPAAPRQVLKMFGGKLTIEQFRESHNNVAKEYRYMLPPYIPINGVVEEINKTINKLPQSSHLKLKRNKPLPGMNNNLFQLMKKT